ncbi:MAG: hypothetical protein RL331_471 [Bacteroidota bacterium]|jgi:hypothetical protein
MKIFFVAVAALALTLSSCKNSQIAYKHYGPVAVDSTQALTLDQMLVAFQANPKNDMFTFSAPLVGVCQSAGCWVNVQPSNGDLIRVRFKDHFLVPPATEINSVAYFHGKAYYDTLSIELQKHFLEDAKAPQSEIDQITAPKIELNFEADGVWVKKSSSKPNK